MSGLVEEIRVGDQAGIKWLNESCVSYEFSNFIPSGFYRTYKRGIGIAGGELLCRKALFSGCTVPVDGNFQQCDCRDGTWSWNSQRSTVGCEWHDYLFRNHCLCLMTTYYPFQANSTRFRKPLKDLMPVQVKLLPLPVPVVVSALLLYVFYRRIFCLYGLIEGY